MKIKLQNIFLDIFKKDPCLTEFSKYQIDSWDSLGHINLIVAIEDEFNIQLTPDEIDLIIDFNSALKTVQSKFC